MKRGFIIGAVLLIAAVTTQAQEPTISDLQKQLQELSAKIAQLETQQAEKIEAIEQKQKDVPDWVATTQIKGDLRYRYENREDNNSTAKDRQRIRGRIGVYGKVNDYADYGVRLAMEQSATSGNNTFGDNFVKEGAYFDLFYVDLHPEQLKGAHVILGKMKQPWLARTGLVWDGDLNPEGLAVTYNTDLNDNLSLSANAGAFVVEEAGGDDVRLQSAQVAFDTKVGDAKIQVGVSDYWFENTEKSTMAKWKNNTPNGGFNLVEGFGSVGIKAADMPVKFYGQVVENTEAVEDATAYLVGVKLGKASNPGTWEVGYNWREIGKDAVLGPFNDSDFNDGNTDSRGHKIGAKYQVSKNVQAGLTYLKTQGSKDIDTVQADLSFKF